MGAVEDGRPKNRWSQCYVLVSEDAREMALITLSQAPQSVREFVETVERWLAVMRQQADHVDALKESPGGEGGSLQ